MLQVEIVNHTSESVNEEELDRAIREILKAHKVLRGRVSVAIVNDKTIHRLNRDYLQHDYETDVLTFPISEPDQNGVLEGEIIASVETAIRAAAELSVDPHGELLLYVIHGTLHLLGYDDCDEQQTVEMRRAEQNWLGKFGYPLLFPDKKLNDQRKP
jgi:probable rRNA maturation factor